MKICRVKIAAFIFIFVSYATACAAQELQVAKGLQGKVNKNVYTSPDKDFEIRIPDLMGGHMRDEQSEKGPMRGEQVILTDDFGQFYRIVSLRSSDITIDSVAEHAFQDARSKSLVEGSRGREWRVIDVEKAGAEVVVTDDDGKQSQPDMVTANAIFSANGRIYHVTVGLPVMFDVTIEERKDQLPQDLDAFLKNFKTLKVK